MPKYAKPSCGPGVLNRQMGNERCATSRIGRAGLGAARVLAILICAASCLVSGASARAAWLPPVAIGTWETPILIEQPLSTFPTAENRYPRVGLSNSGTAVATWVGPSRNGFAPQTVFAGDQASARGLAARHRSRAARLKSRGRG